MLSYWFINKSKLLHQVGLTNHFKSARIKLKYVLQTLP